MKPLSLQDLAGLGAGALLWFSGYAGEEAGLVCSHCGGTLRDDEEALMLRRDVPNDGSVPATTVGGGRSAPTRAGFEVAALHQVCARVLFDTGVLRVEGVFAREHRSMRS